MARLLRFSDLKATPVESKWFKVYELPYWEVSGAGCGCGEKNTGCGGADTDCGASDCGGGAGAGRNAPKVYAIFEPYHFQEVISYLVIGCDKAMLVDTGMGLGNIRAIVEFLTDLPVVVVNSHSHFDHVGDNWRFDKVHLLDVMLPNALGNDAGGPIRSCDVLEAGSSMPINDENCSLEAYQMPGSPDPSEFWFDYTDLTQKPCKVVPVQAGHVFDLGGGLTFRVISTPGHSDDGLMLVSDEYKMMFTGDTIYPAGLYAHLSQSNLALYRDVVWQLAKEYAEYTLFCSHNNPVWSGDALVEVAEAFDVVIAKKANGESTETEEFRFDGADFSIIA